MVFEDPHRADEMSASRFKMLMSLLLKKHIICRTN